MFNLLSVRFWLRNGKYTSENQEKLIDLEKQSMWQRVTNLSSYAMSLNAKTKIDELFLLIIFPP